MPDISKTAESGSRSLRIVAEGTAAAIGDEFFRSLARCAAQALGARYAFAAETVSEMESRSLAFWEGSDFGEGFSYRFPGTPCLRVAAGHVCVTGEGLQEKFPDDLWLQQIGAVSYVGVPMRNAQGRTLGHIAVLHTEPMEPTDEDLTMLKIFAARGCAELERKLVDERLRKANAELQRANVETEALLNITRAIGHHLHRGVLFGALAECLQTAVPSDSFGIILPRDADQLEGYMLTKNNLHSETARSRILPRAGTAGDWVMRRREWHVSGSTEEIRDEFPGTWRILREEKMESLCVLPLVAGENVRGALFFMAAAPAAFDGVRRPFLDQVASVVAVALDDCLAQEEIRRLGDELASRRISELESQKREVSDQLAEAHRALESSEQRLLDLFEEAPIAYVLEGFDTKFIRANRTAMRILGITPEEVPHTYGKTFVHDSPENQRKLREVFDTVSQGSDAGGIILEMRRRNGEAFWIQWWSRPDPGGACTRTMFLDVTDRVLMEKERAELAAQNVYLQEEILSQHNFAEIVGNSPALISVLRQVDQIALSDASVLVFGETGTGKELVARAIHDRSARRERPLVKVNCGAISAGLVESELFGHIKGAFTGAIGNRDGRFKLADGGTIFLDEVGELALETQVKLLRVLQEQEFEPLGSSRTVRVNVRVIAATNRDLSAMVREGKFRGDLYYRLNVVPLTMPPLRERPADIPLLAMFFLEKYARKLGRPIEQITEETVARLCRYSWPGNIRELQNVIERAVVLSTGKLLAIERNALPDVESSNSRAHLSPAAGGTSLEDIERQHILQVLEQSSWRIEGAGGAALALDLQPSTLRSRMRKLGIARPAG